MGIRTKNLHNIVLPLLARNTLSATINKDIAKVPFSGYISGVVCKVMTPGSGATNTIMDVNLNGTTIFADATKITMASTTGVCTYSALATKPTPVTYGSIISLDIDSCGTATLNAVVEVTISRTPIYTCDNNENQDEVF
jgi:hypothetical protein